MEERYLTVTGMHCAGCVASVQQKLLATKGVIEAEVNLLEGRTRVVYQPEVVSPQLLREVVRGIGFDLLIDDSAAEREAELARKSTKALASHKRRLLVTVALTLLTVALGFWQEQWLAKYGILLCTTFIYFYGGGGYHSRSIKQLRHGTFTMDTLISLSTTVAYFYSIAQMFLPTSELPAGLFGSSHFSMVGMIFSFVLMGKYIEERAKHHTQDALRALLQLAPEQALVRNETTGKLQERPVAELKVGDVVVLRKGDRLPVDGVLLEPATLDESTITGEPIPVDKEAGEEVYSGTTSVGMATAFRTTKVGEHTALGRIIEAVRQAQASKAPIQRLADKISGIFVPVVLAIALFTLLGWGLGASVVAPWLHGIYFAITVLVVACPCALGLATPTAVTVAMGRASQMGVLIRNAATLEELARVDHLVFDKTGTLTIGKPSITAELWLQPKARAPLVAAEAYSTHPLAKAIVKAYKEKVPHLSLTTIEEQAGGGVAFVYEGNTYRVGNRTFVGLHNLPEQAQAFEAQHHLSTLIYYATENSLLAILVLDDAPRPELPSTLTQLQKELGVQAHLLSGDTPARASAFATEIGITRGQGGLSPTGKRTYIEGLQKAGGVVAMVGDGINDSPALATANVSIAMASGSHIANSVASVTLTGHSLLALPRAMQLARNTKLIIKQNFFWAFCYNLVAIPLATGIFYPMVALSPMVGAAAMAGSSVIVVLNSLRLRR